MNRKIHLIEKLDKRNRMVWLETVFALQTCDIESTIDELANYAAERMANTVAHYREIEENA